MNTDRDRFAEIDGLRGLAISQVLVWHFINNAAAISTELTPTTKAVLTGLPFSLGWTGVDLFFVISGFLIGGIVINIKERQGSLSSYAIRRFFRIVPLYAVLIALYFAVYLLANPPEPDALWNWSMGASPAPFFAFVTFTNNIWMAMENTFGPIALGPTWSLGVEAQFYLLAPIIIYAAPKKYLPYACMAIIVAAIIARQILLAEYGRLAAFVSMPARMDTLFMGVLIAWLYRSGLAENIVMRRGGLIAGYALAATMLVIALHISSPRVFAPWMQSYGYTIIGSIYAALLLLACFGERMTWLSKALRFTPLRQLGVISYGVYLFHFPVHSTVLHMFGRAGPAANKISDFGAPVVSTALTLLLAFALWKTVEAPMIQIGRRLSDQAQ